MDEKIYSLQDAYNGILDLIQSCRTNKIDPANVPFYIK